MLEADCARAVRATHAGCGVTLDQRKALRRRAIWRVTDFARYVGIESRAARRLLLRYNVELGGLLLRPSSGTNRGWTFYWASLARHAPDAFVDDPLEQQQRLDSVEDAVDSMSVSQRAIAAQTGQNTRDIAHLKSRRVA